MQILLPILLKRIMEYIPPNILEGITIHFAIDYTDLSNDSPDGNHEIHGTGQKQEMER